MVRIVHYLPLSLPDKVIKPGAGFTAMKASDIYKLTTVVYMKAELHLIKPW